MSKLDDLINKLCPDGVEYKKFGEVTEIGKGIQFNKENMADEGTYPVINGGINPSGFIEQYNTDENTITVSQGGASAGYVNFITTKFWAGAHCYVIKPLENVLNRYIFHFIKSQEYKLQECQYGAGIPALSKGTVSELEIPVPPLEIQNEIVRILDNFTELEEELEEELKIRKEQYKYYRDNLFDVDSNIEWKTIGEIAKAESKKNKDQKCKLAYSITKGGLVPTAEYFKDAKVTSDDTSGYKIVKKNWFVYSPSRIDVGSINFLQNQDEVIVSPLNVVFSIDETQLEQKYLLYFLLSHKGMFQILNQRLGIEGTGRKMLPFENFSKIKIPLPSISEQKRVVAILEKFDSLCNDITSGLPAEIEARHKQYEYYRDKLLTFKRKSA